MLKRVMGVATALALMAPIGIAVAKPAGAVPVLKCAKPSGSVTFKPGITSTAKIQTTTFSLPIKNCTGTKGFTSGTSTGKTVGKEPTNCSNFGDAATQATKVTIKWNNGKQSTASLKTKIVPGAPGSLTASVSGKISKGAFTGKIVKTKVTVTLKGNCTSTPITKAVLKGVAALTIG
jgi:hypothetical protein